MTSRLFCAGKRAREKSQAAEGRVRLQNEDVSDFLRQFCVFRSAPKFDRGEFCHFPERKSLLSPE